jgi:hypothetical protein
LNAHDVLYDRTVEAPAVVEDLKAALRKRTARPISDMIEVHDGTRT